MQQPKQQQPSPMIMISMHDALSKDAVSTAESLSAMMHNERTTYKRNDYFHPPSPDPAAPPQERHEDGNNVPQEVPEDQDQATTMTMVNENDRLQIVDWCYSVVDQCNFDRETVAIAIDMMDRFLSLSCSSKTSSSSSGSTNNANTNVNPYSRIAHTALHNRKSFQLLSMSALYSAIKMNETVALGATFFSAMSRGTYSVTDIEGMELTLLNGLGWRCCAPTGIQMAHHILSLLLPHLTNDEQRSDGEEDSGPDEAMWNFILDEIRFQTESAVRDKYFTSKRPSTIAMAAIFNALTQIPKRVRQAFLRALLVLMNNREFMFDSPQELLNGRNRLKCFIEGDTSNVNVGAVQDHPRHHGAAAGDRSERDREHYYRDQREQDDIIALALVIHQPFAHVAQPPLVPQVIEDFDDDDDDGDDSSLSSCSDSEVEQAAATMSSSSLKRVRSSDDTDDDDDDDDDSSTATTDDHEETPRRKAARIDNGRVAETSLTRTVTPTDSFRGNRKQSFPN